jgi:dTDP-4-amino-4,6-dideoxygalactose transaminase
MIEIPIAKPLIGEAEKAAISEVIDSGLLAQGPKVLEFEKKFADYVGTNHAIAASSGTTAIHLALLGHGIGPGDEVITTPFTFIATATPILFCGAKPVFVDIDPKSFNIDPSQIESAITEKTKAIMPVHLYGHPATMDHIKEIAEAKELVVIEDACQAHGAKYHGQFVGSIGDCGAFSFYPTKNMTTSEGGMVTTNDSELAERLTLLRNHGQLKRYDYNMVGYNFRMTDISAAIGLVQIAKLGKFIESRVKNAGRLTKGLEGIVEVPYVAPDVEHVFNQYTIKQSSRDGLKEALEKDGIGSAIYYPKPLNEFPVFHDYVPENFNAPISSEVSHEVLSIPVHPGLSDEHVDKIIESIKTFINK